MSTSPIQDILQRVEQPSRYLGTEINAVRKDPGKVKLQMALAFPDLYEIGMSHFGIQILYHVLNSRQEIAAERVYAPAADMEKYLRNNGVPLVSLETQTPLRQFHIIGFSLLYELNYTNIINMLNLAKIPAYAAERDDRYPLVIAGGPCTCNPEPVADFFDAMVIGDGEEAVLDIAETWIRWRNSSEDRQALLEAWTGIQGVYVPSKYRIRFSQNQFQEVSSSEKATKSVRRRILYDLDKSPFPTEPIVPFSRPVHDRLRLEISRGCSRGCRFCQAGMLYRPVRERSCETLLKLFSRSYEATGYEEVSLLSLSTGDYCSMTPFMQGLMRRCEKMKVAVSLPSIRAGSLTPELMRQIRKVRKTGFTIAPEAGSQRQRDAINKNLSEKEIVDTVQNAFNLGWRLIKLYFMIGLPFERKEDLEQLVSLVKTLAGIKGEKGKGGQINVSLATFIPKPHTPFQWARQISIEESKERIGWLKDRLDIPGIKVKWQNPEMSYLEGLFARGDRRLSGLLVRAHELGCRFDGWGDFFNYDKWIQAFSDTGLNPERYTTRLRERDEPLPWDHLDIGVKKAFLWEEWEKAESSLKTEDCRWGGCSDCGVCDFSELEPRLFESEGHGAEQQETEDLPISTVCHVRLAFQKLDNARFFGHLEMAKIFQRALRRAGIPVKFSQGYHPMPRMFFADTLPLGMESKAEFLFLILEGTAEPGDIMKHLNRELPDGIRVMDCLLLPEKGRMPELRRTLYTVTLNTGVFDPEKIRTFMEAPSHPITRVNRKGRRRQLDLKAVVLDIHLLGASQLSLELKSASGKIFRPIEILSEIFGLSREELRAARIIKIEETAIN